MGDNGINFLNPLYSSTLSEHIYDDVNENQEKETKNKVLSGDLPRGADKGADKGADSDTIKSNEVKFDESGVHYNAKTSDKSTEQYNNPSKSKNANKPVAIDEDRHHLATSKTLSEDEYLLPDIKYIVENQIASQNESQKVDNDQSTPLLVSWQKQPEAYQELVGQKPPPSS